MPCSTRNVLILPQTTTYGTATVTRVTSLITGLNQSWRMSRVVRLCCFRQRSGRNKTALIYHDCWYG
eukprot:1899931-Rhodomonas_salina.1